MKDVRKLKQLQTQLNTMKGDAEAMKIELSAKQTAYNQKLQSIKKLKQEIDKIDKVSELKVSEHAITRYFERVKGFEIGEIEDEILSESVRGLVEKLGGSGTYPNGDYSVVIKDYTVTTIVKH